MIWRRYTKKLYRLNGAVVLTPIPIYKYPHVALKTQVWSSLYTILFLNHRQIRKQWFFLSLFFHLYVKYRWFRRLMLKNKFSNYWRVGVSSIRKSFRDTVISKFNVFFSLRNQKIFPEILKYVIKIIIRKIGNVILKEYLFILEVYESWEIRIHLMFCQWIKSYFL